MCRKFGNIHFVRDNPMCPESGAILIGNSQSGLIGLILGFVFSVAFLRWCLHFLQGLKRGPVLKNTQKVLIVKI